MDRFLTVTHMGENGTAKKAILSLPVSFINPKLLHYQTLQEIKYQYLFFIQLITYWPRPMSHAHSYVLFISQLIIILTFQQKTLPL